MLVRTMEQIEAEGRVISISHGKATAVRLLTKADGLNFSISEARGGRVGVSNLWYKNHWEANFVRSGNATLENRATGERWALEPGDSLVFRGDQRHSYRNLDARRPAVGISVVCFAPVAA